MPIQDDPTGIQQIIIPDFESNKIEIFEGINDEPIAPTETEGSNISHVHDSINKLVDTVVSGHTELRKAIQYNYDYIYYKLPDVYAKIDNNETTITTALEGINANSATISSNRLDANNRLIRLEGNIESINTKVDELDAIINPNESTFVFENVSLSPYANNTYIYDITIPKTGTLTKIEFNDVNQLSEIYLEYSGTDQTTSENLGSDENYPYVLDFDPTISVTENSQLRIYTEYQEPTLTSIKLTIV